MNHASLIRKWPTLKRFADDLNIKYGTAKAMRRRGSVPPEYWEDIVAAASEQGIKGVTLEALAAGAPKRKKPTPHQSPAPSRSAQGAS